MAWISKLGIAVLVLADVVCAAQNRPKRVPAPPERPMIVHNPDGTFIVQMERPKGEVEGGTPSKGLVIPKQLVIPFVHLSRQPSAANPRR